MTKGGDMMKNFLAFVGVIALVAAGYMICKYDLIGQAVVYLKGIGLFG